MWVRFADLVVLFRFEPKSGKVPYEMTPFGDPGVVANRARLEAWGATTTLLLSRMGYRDIRVPPTRQRNPLEIEHHGKQEWSTRFSSASAGRCRGFGELRSSLFIL